MYLSSMGQLRMTIIVFNPQAEVAKEKEALDSKSNADPLVGKLSEFFDRPALLPYKAHVQPALDLLKDKPWILYTLMCVLPLPLLLIFRRGGRRPSGVREIVSPFSITLKSRSSRPICYTSYHFNDIVVCVT